MRYKAMLFRIFTVMTAFSLILTFIACEQDLPLTTEQNVENHVTILKVKDDPGISLKKLFSKQKLIGADGGNIVLGSKENGYSYVRILRNAINENEYPDGVLIEFIWQSEQLLQADFYPEGLVFDIPIPIRFSYKDADLNGINEEDLGIYYYNPLTENYEFVSTSKVNTRGKYIGAYINHFSRYAIGLE